MQTQSLTNNDAPSKYRLSGFSLWILVITPILQMYKFVGPVTMGEVGLVICVFAILIRNNQFMKIKADTNLLLILGYMLIVTIMGNIWLNGDLINSAKEYLVFAIYYLIVFFLVDEFSVDEFLQKYMAIALIMSVLIILQFAFYQLFRITIPGLIPGVTTYAGANTSEYIYKNASRASGFFTEPAMAARYLGIPFLVAIIEVSKEERLINSKVIILLLALLFTLSGNAITTVLLGFGVYLIEAVKKKDVKSALYIIIAIIAIIIGATFLNRTATFSRLFSRFSEISGNSTMKSGYIRIVRGFQAYWNLPLPAKLFGIGFGNYGIVIRDYIYSIVTAETSLIAEWINGIQDYFVYGGVIAGLLYLHYLAQQYRKGKWEQRCILMLFIVYLFMAGMFCEPLWVFFMLLIMHKEGRKQAI